MPAWTVPGYTELRDLGSGASGRVVLATHDATGTSVAIKYLADRLCADSAFRSAFRSEAELLAGLTSPYVAALYEYVEAPRTAAIVMELVEGINLRRLIRREGPVGPEAALAVLKGSLLGLAAAHDCGVVHRDYKPDNVLVGRDGTSKLVDFGIAARDGDRANSAGTPAYMAPEQWHGGPSSPATDVYAATACFFECLTGRKPYTGETLVELAVQHATAPVPAQDEDVPEAVRELVRRGLAKVPQERPAHAAAFVDDLEAVAGSTYGPDWERRGQNKLAALAALFPLLLPLPQDAQGSTVDLATTKVGGKLGGRLARHKLLLSTGTLVLTGALAAAAVAGGTGPGSAGSARADVGATTRADALTPDAVPGTTAPGGEGSGSPARPSSSGAGSLSGGASPSGEHESAGKNPASSGDDDSGVPDTAPGKRPDPTDSRPTLSDASGDVPTDGDEEGAGNGGADDGAGNGDDEASAGTGSGEDSAGNDRDDDGVGNDGAGNDPGEEGVGDDRDGNGDQDGPSDSVTPGFVSEDDDCFEWEVRVTARPRGTVSLARPSGECKP